MSQELKMTHDRPLIPKRLAAKIRGAQEKVYQKRLSIVSAKHNILGDFKRVREYERDPEAFARFHYRGHAVDSYPVQKNISTCRERISYENKRKHERILELTELETSLLRITKTFIDFSKIRRTFSRRDMY